MQDNIVADKSYFFAVRVVRAYQYLKNNKDEFVLSKQLLRSGTAIGALVRESKFAQSRADFVNKLSIALKEANESQYWITLLRDTDILEGEIAESLLADAREITAILSSIVKTSKGTA